MYRENRRYVALLENRYDLALFEVVYHIQNVQEYLARLEEVDSLEQVTQDLIRMWREANLAKVYLAHLPSAGHGLGQTKRFLNEVSEFSYAVSRKTLREEELTEEDEKGIERLYEYSMDLIKKLIVLMDDIDSGNMNWRELTREIDVPFAQAVCVICDGM
ncbi:MAG: germination protein YpeB [Oscillospiraceae bacterium]|nr:germination protein YpeB [Oscillospiraceae bacterium]